MLDREAFERIDGAIRQLPPREQSVLRESMEGKSADQIAQVLWNKGLSSRALLKRTTITHKY